MAATLDRDQDEIVHFSFPIEKREDTATINPVDGTPDILITGKATDGTIDGDMEIVDPEWSAKAIQEWADTGGNVRMSHDPKRPVGKGQHVEVTTDGHYVTSLIADPLAKHFIRTGVLNDYSVGISMPGFRQRDSRLDPQGKALRIITGRSDGLSRIAELSVVDRGSNFNSRFQIVRKSAGNGDGDEFAGQMIGDEDEIAKAAPGNLLTKAARDDDFVNVDLPKGASISISPADFAALKTFKQQLTVKSAALPDTEKRDIDTATRRRLASEGHALPDGSYPIENAEDLHNAAILARSGHGNVAGAERLIAHEAQERGVANPLDSDAGKSAAAGKETVEKADAPDVQDEAVPDVAKDKPVKKAKKKPKGGKKLPPWLNKPEDDGGDGKGPSGDDACKGAHAWIHVGGDSPVPDIRCEKCKTTPAEAAGLSGTHDMTAAPVPEFLESPPVASTKGSPTPASASGNGETQAMKPVPAHREPDGAIVEPFEHDAKLPPAGQGETPTRLEAGMMKSSPEVAAILRFKGAGIDAELGRIHDLTCPAYHPEDVSKCHPFADFATMDEGYFQRKAVEGAAGPSLDMARSVNLAWQAAHVLKTADPAVLNDYRMEAHKAFRDANPGPGTAPSPMAMSPQKYNRPLVTDGHAAASPGHSGPNTSPQVATTAPDAHSFDRPPLASGHQSPSPSHMKSSFEYPDGTGRPQQLNYAQMDKERGRMALVEMHDHLGRQFPEVCPMDRPGDRPLRGVQPENHPVPNAMGVGKNVSGQTVSEIIDQREAAAVVKAPSEDLGTFADAEVYKGFKKARKKLGKKILSGKMTVDEARAHLGRQFAQKAAEPVAEAADELITAGLTKSQLTEIVRAAMPVSVAAEPVMLEAANWGAGPEVIKAAVAEATAGLRELLVKQQETLETKLADQQRVIDAIADQPDPSTAAFSGVAFNPVRKTARPAGVLTQAEAAERSQQMMIRHLADTVNSASDPYEREAARASLTRLRGGDA